MKRKENCLTIVVEGWLIVLYYRLEPLKVTNIQSISKMKYEKDIIG